MSIVEPGSMGARLTARVRAILLEPKATWETIDQEPASLKGLYLTYVMPLAAIGPVAGFIGAVVFGNPKDGVAFHPPVLNALGAAVTAYLATLIGVMVLAVVINAFAPPFGATRNQVQAVKVAAYSGTAAWVAGIFLIFPPLAPLAFLAGIYSLYLLYLGLPRLMASARGKTAAYVVLAVAVSILINLVVTAIAAPIKRVGEGASAAGAVTAVPASRSHSVDMSKLEAAGEQLSAAAARAKDLEPIDPEVLKSFLPATAAGYRRTALRAGSLGSDGVSGSRPRPATPRAMGPIPSPSPTWARPAPWPELPRPSTWSPPPRAVGAMTGSARPRGRMSTESYDNASKHGSYGVLVAERFMVQAEGDAAPMASLKAAVSGIDLARLQVLAKPRPDPDRPVPPAG
uniref:YIP1 family protein n=1 Tax=Phenylobacterium glaciei TaxID=2803784 RepID=A0A974P164_9CAUL|nr:YIP1 family protein [Phenylobacterium glaciei]